MVELTSALQQDALPSSHPMSPPQEHVQTIYEISNMFDAITYHKVERLMSQDDASPLSARL